MTSHWPMADPVRRHRSCRPQLAPLTKTPAPRQSVSGAAWRWWPLTMHCKWDAAHGPQVCWRRCTVAILHTAAHPCRLRPNERLSTPPSPTSPPELALPQRSASCHMKRKRGDATRVLRGGDDTGTCTTAFKRRCTATPARRCLLFTQWRRV
eukprot:CAMPEP_0196663572 /NCGR_PEP_ID=MMETSP1086-20130531/53404_1 /TAXON_ID=77921 /ORGANISM="Cyanoptyche  gloeocystis , Strain SAG4.97" /LENGTH=151 /DNA_ID=CAMNT_0041999447 /DNA_START=391 /DNA_END=843 /DNA_ORIENTATION=+